MKAYKLTDENMETMDGTKWGEGVTHKAIGEDKCLCSDGWIHFYTDLLIGIFMNPIHANFENLIAWECETRSEELHAPLKSGCKQLTTVKQVPLPRVTTTQRVAFSILCALEICKDANFVKWAHNWLSNIDRTNESATTIYGAIYFIDAAAYATNAANYATNYATNAATSAAANYAAANYAAATSANAVANAAAYAATAASAAAFNGKYIDFSAIAKKALQYT